MKVLRITTSPEAADIDDLQMALKIAYVRFAENARRPTELMLFGITVRMEEVEETNAKD